MSFKPKTDKTIQVSKTYNTTIDIIHNNVLNNFLKEENTIIPDLKKEKKQIQQILKKNTFTAIDEKMIYIDRLNEINTLLFDFSYKKNKYLLDNSKYIFEYFEDKKKINEGTQTTKPSTSSKNQILFNIFKVDESNTNNNATNNNVTNNNATNNNATNNNTTNHTTNNNTTNNNATNHTTNHATNIVQNYFSNIDDSYIDLDMYTCNQDICSSCLNGEMIPLDDEGILICNICAVSIPYLIENEKPSYKEPPKEVCFYAYKKINHFKEILSQFQGKETTQIPQAIIEQIQKQIKKERIQPSKLNYNETKSTLKKLGLNKYYEHIAFIKNKLGVKPPTFSTELEDTLCNLFMEIQAPYAKVCPNDRVNFLNYYYVLYKFLELLKEPTYLQEIPMLKDREKLIEQDEIWKKICNDLNWDFISTI